MGAIVVRPHQEPPLESSSSDSPSQCTNPSEPSAENHAALAAASQQQLQSLTAPCESRPPVANAPATPVDALQRQLFTTERQLLFALRQGEVHVPQEDPQSGLIDFEALAGAIERAEDHSRRGDRLLRSLENLGLDPGKLESHRAKLAGFQTRLADLRGIQERSAGAQPPASGQAPSRAWDLHAGRTGRRLGGQAVYFGDRTLRWMTEGIRNALGEEAGFATQTLLDGTLRLSATPYLVLSPLMLEENFHLVQAGEPHARPVLWQSVLLMSNLAELESQGINIPHEHMGSYESFIAHLREEGIEHPERIHNLNTALHILHNRQHPEELGRDRPIAVVVAGSCDWNGALARQSIPENLVESGQFDVVYLEANSPAHMMRQLRDIHNQSGRPVHSLVMMGHGSQNSFRFGEHSRLHTGDIHRSDSGHVYSSRLQDLDQLLDPEGQVVLASCRVADTDEEDAMDDFPNLATALTALLPGRPVHASTTANGAFSLNVHPDRSIDVFSMVDSMVVLESDLDTREVRELEEESDQGLVPGFIGPLFGGIADLFA